MSIESAKYLVNPDEAVRGGEHSIVSRASCTYHVIAGTYQGETYLQLAKRRD